MFSLELENLTFIRVAQKFQSDLILWYNCYTKIKMDINYISMVLYTANQSKWNSSLFQKLAYPNVQGGPKKVYDVI